MADIERLWELTQSLVEDRAALHDQERAIQARLGEVEEAQRGLLTEHSDDFASGAIRDSFGTTEEYSQFLATCGADAAVDPYDRERTAQQTATAIFGLISGGGNTVGLYSTARRVDFNAAGTWLVGNLANESTVSVDTGGEVARLVINACVEGSSGDQLKGTIGVAEIAQYYANGGSQSPLNIANPIAAVGKRSLHWNVQRLIVEPPKAGTIQEEINLERIQAGLLDAILRSSITLDDLGFDPDWLREIRSGAVERIGFRAGRMSDELLVAAINPT